MADNKFGWASVKTNFRSRSQARARSTLGVVQQDIGQPVNVYRSKELAKLDAYYDSTQYDHLPPWDQAKDANDQHLSVRKRKPRLNHPFAKTLAQRLTAKLIGLSVFPSFIVEDQPDDTEFFKAILRESNLRTAIVEPTRVMLNGGSCFLRFWLSYGVMKTEWYSAKFTYPTFQPNGELESVDIKYVFEDPAEKDENGNSKKKWFKITLGMNEEILFDNPDFKTNVEPVFEEVERVQHDLGFVQGEWMRVGDTSGENESIDGYGLTSDLMDFIDELNYSLSQSSQAVSYNQDPQLVLNGISEEETDSLIRSVMKSWNLGMKGTAQFLESNLDGVKVAMDLRDKVRLNIQEITRVLLLDPEKIVGSAQSAKAMEVLYGPLKDLVDELRPIMEKLLKHVLQKMALMILVAAKKGIDTPLMLPPGYVPQSLDLTVDWPPIFQQTMEDLQKKVQVASSAKTTGLIAPKTAIRYIAKDFGIEDIDAEIAEIDAAAAAAAALNPFGGF